MTIQPCGDSMLLVELEAAIDPVINERAILLASRVRACQAHVDIRDGDLVFGDRQTVARPGQGVRSSVIRLEVKR